jgi:DNA-binding transcriptional LysR family regulator
MRLTPVMRKLADNHRVIAAAPAYLEASGTPRSPADLPQHKCLYHGVLRAAWRLVGSGGEIRDVSVDSRLRSDNGEVSLDWALAGCGLILKSWIDVEAELRGGCLIQVLPEWRSEEAPVCALFPSNRLVPTRVRLFLDAMATRLENVRRA